MGKEMLTDLHATWSYSTNTEVAQTIFMKSPTSNFIQIIQWFSSCHKSTAGHRFNPYPANVENIVSS